MRRRPLLLLPCLALLAFAGTGFKQPLTWGPPSIGGEVRTIDVPVSGGEWYGIPATTDCVVRMPNVPVQARVKVDGCHNIRLVGGELHSDVGPCSAAANGSSESPAIYFNNWSGVAHIEGVKITGPGFSDGIWMTSTHPNSVGQVEGTWIGRLAACQEPVTGYENGWPAEHPDCFQTWSGPNVLRIDKNTCFTIYEGFNVDTNSVADYRGDQAPGAADRHPPHERPPGRAGAERPGVLRRVPVVPSRHRPTQRTPSAPSGTRGTSRPSRA